MVIEKSDGGKNLTVNYSKALLIGASFSINGLNSSANTSNKDWKVVSLFHSLVFAIKLNWLKKDGTYLGFVSTVRT